MEVLTFWLLGFTPRLDDLRLFFIQSLNYQFKSNAVGHYK